MKIRRNVHDVAENSTQDVSSAEIGDRRTALDIAMILREPSRFVVRVIGGFYSCAGYAVTSYSLTDGWYLGSILGGIALLGGLGVFLNSEWAKYLVFIASLTVIVFLAVIAAFELKSAMLEVFYQPNFHTLIPSLAFLFLAIMCPILVFRHFKSPASST